MFAHNRGDTYLPTSFAEDPTGVRLAASTVRDSASGELIIKIVNGEDAAQPLAIRLAGAERTVFGGAPADIANSDDVPPTVVPITATVPLSAEFSYEAPANSLTILRIPGS